MEDRNRYIKYVIIVVSFTFFGYVSSIVSTDVECVVDYRGVIHFNVKLPRGYDRWQRLQPAFMYRAVEQEDWLQERDCVLSDDNEEFQCAMHELKSPEKQFEFKVSIRVNQSLIDITSLNFASGNDTWNETPWIYYNNLRYCSDSYGVKYIATNATDHSISVEWILLPLDADNANIFKSEITLEGDGMSKERYHVTKGGRDTNCKQDFCRYEFSSTAIRPCKNYKVCIETNGNNGEKSEMRTKCRLVQTYCEPIDPTASRSNSSNWQDILLCALGVIMLFVCVLLLRVVYNKRRKIIESYNSNNSESDIIDQSELVCGNTKWNNVGALQDGGTYMNPCNLVTTMTPSPSMTSMNDVNIHHRDVKSIS